MRYLLICIIGFALQAAFILVENRKKYVPAVILKGSAAMVFIIVGALSAQFTSNPQSRFYGCSAVCYRRSIIYSQRRYYDLQHLRRYTKILHAGR